MLEIENACRFRAVLSLIALERYRSGALLVAGTEVDAEYEPRLDMRRITSNADEWHDIEVRVAGRTPLDARS